MSRSTRRVSAVALTAALMGAWLAVAAPAAALDYTWPSGVTVSNAGSVVDPDYTVTIDCLDIKGETTYDFSTDQFYAVLPTPIGSVATLDLVNCDEATIGADNDDETRVVAQYTALDGPDAGDTQVIGVDFADEDTVTLTGTQYELGPNMSFVVSSGDRSTSFFVVWTSLAVEIDDPQGELLDIVDFLIPGDATPDLVVDDDPQYWNSDDELLLGGVTECHIEPGDHFYGSSIINVETAGTYTFRLADLDPDSEDVDNTQPNRYLTDPFLALYSSFDPDNGHLGVVACDDDSDLDLDSSFYITSSNTLMSDRYPQLTAELQPGVYTLVLTSFDPESAFILVAAPASAADAIASVADPKGTFTPAAFGEDEAATVELWYAESELAATGPSPVSGGMLAAGLALMTLGGLVFATRRLWSRA